MTPKFEIDGLAVGFHRRAVEDRNETMRQGKTMYRNEDLVIIYLPGGNDKREHIADDAFFARRSPKWRDMYDAWVKGEEPAVTDGTPIDQAPFITPAQAASCKANNVLSVEQLAEAADQVVERLGMGFREVQTKARNFMKASASKGKVAEELSAKDVKIATLEKELVEARRFIAELEGRIRGLESMGGAVAAAPQAPAQMPIPRPERKKAARVDDADGLTVQEKEEAASTIEEVINRNKAKPKAGAA